MNNEATETKTSTEKGGLVQDVVMMFSATFPNERNILEALWEYASDTQKEILELVYQKKPLPVGTEIKDPVTGEWIELSETALKAANRTGIYVCEPCAWHYSWRDIWPRLRITS